MKKKSIVALRLSAAILSLILLSGLVSCKEEKLPDLWADATYTEDKNFGDGETTVVVEVVAGDKSVSFTIKTDKETLGDALLEHNLIAGDAGSYGLYVKYVNGIFADYDINGAYWGFFRDGEYMMTGIDATQISDGEHYELVYTK